MVTIVYSDVAKEEIKVAAIWYEERKENLGSDFEQAVRDKIETIGKFPERYPVIKSNLREVRVKRFPFKVIYKFYKTKKVILIASIFHTSRNPKHKYKH